jgi:hypothetical protein
MQHSREVLSPVPPSRSRPLLPDNEERQRMKARGQPSGMSGDLTWLAWMKVSGANSRARRCSIRTELKYRLRNSVKFTRMKPDQSEGGAVLPGNLPRLCPEFRNLLRKRGKCPESAQVVLEVRRAGIAAQPVYSERTHWISVLDPR